MTTLLSKVDDVAAFGASVSVPGTFETSGNLAKPSLSGESRHEADIAKSTLMDPSRTHSGGKNRSSETLPNQTATIWM